MSDLDFAILKRDPDAARLCRRRLVLNDIPVDLHDGLIRYLVDGIRPGSFLCAVLENNLREAVVRANPVNNLLALPNLMRFLFTEAPAESHGSPDRVVAWLQLGASARFSSAEARPK